MLTKEFSRTNYILTDGCNLNCDFCFQQATHRSNKQLTKEEIIKYTEFTLKHCIVKNPKKFNINIIGGEPLLYKDFSIMKTVVDLFYEKYNTIGQVSIFTNGTIWNNTFIEFCKYIKGKAKRIVIVTTGNFFDYMPNRIFDKNKEIFNQNISKLKEELPFAEIFTEYVFDRNIKNNYEEIIEYNINNTDKKNIGFAEYSTSEKNLTENDFYNFSKIFFKVLKKYGITNNDLYSKKLEEQLDNCGLNYLKSILYDFKIYNKTFCKPLSREFGIAPEGYFCPCSRALAFKKDFPTIYEDEESIIKKLKKYSNKNINLQAKNEEGMNCFDCLLKADCLSCKIMPFGYIEKDGIFYTPKEKCKYQLEKFNGQYRALKEWLTEE